MHGDLVEKIYMKQPVGFVRPCHENLVCLLKKSMYGLKQVPRQWYINFDTFMIKIRFLRCDYDNYVWNFHTYEQLHICQLFFQPK